MGHLGCLEVCVASESVGRMGEKEKEEKEEEPKWPGGHTAYCT